jgi:hypothetical protein
MGRVGLEAGLMIFGQGSMVGREWLPREVLAQRTRRAGVLRGRECNCTALQEKLGALRGAAGEAGFCEGGRVEQGARLGRRLGWAGLSNRLSGAGAGLTLTGKVLAQRTGAEREGCGLGRMWGPAVGADGVDERRSPFQGGTVTMGNTLQKLIRSVPIICSVPIIPARIPAYTALTEVTAAELQV